MIVIIADMLVIAITDMLLFAALLHQCNLNGMWGENWDWRLEASHVSVVLQWLTRCELASGDLNTKAKRIATTKVFLNGSILSRTHQLWYPTHGGPFFVAFSLFPKIVTRKFKLP